MSEQQHDFIGDVRTFMSAACTTDDFNIRQTALYIGLQAEELAEKMEAMGLRDYATILHNISARFKKAEHDNDVFFADREKLLDADADIAWVTVGSMYSQGADVYGALKEVARANNSKVLPNGTVIRDESGKIQKPAGFTPPDLTPFVNKGMAK